MKKSEQINQAKQLIERAIIDFSVLGLGIKTLTTGHPIFTAMWAEIEKLSPTSMLPEKEEDCNCPACQFKKEIENLPRTANGELDGARLITILKNHSTKPDVSVDQLLKAVGIEPKKYRGLEPSGCQCPTCKIVDEMIEKNDAEITQKAAGPIEMVYDVKVPIKTEPEGRGFMYVLQEKLKATDVKVSAYNIHLDEEENPVAVSFEMILPSKRG